MLETSVSLVLMIAELMIAEYIFASRLSKKSLFPLRLFGSFVICVEAIFIVIALFYRSTDILFSYSETDNWENSLFKLFLYIFAFVLTIGGMKFCFDASIWLIMFYCSGAYATQHMAKNIASLIGFFTVGTEGPAYWLIEAGVCVCTFALVWLLFVRNRTQPDDRQEVYKKVLLSFAVIFICVLLSRFTVDNGARGVISFVVETIYGVVCCVLVLVVLSGINKMDRIRNDLVITEEILKREREQYKLSKEKVELIDMKYHDLKHQLSQLREGWSEERIAKIEDAIMICGAIVRTGNDVLDVILTEKSLQCEKNGISLTCTCNGEDLSFMDKCDIYALFGNALSNAIESAGKIEDESRRSIVMDMRSVGGILSVHIENFYAGNLVMKDGFPVTDKDKAQHGFGIKSMNYIAAQYGGHMSISAQNGRFCLDFIFPVREKDKKAAPAGKTAKDPAR